MSEHKQSKLIISIIGVIVLGVQFFTSLLFVFALLKLNILQTWQIALVIGILALIFAYNVFELFFRKRAKLFGKIASCVVAILISGGCIFAYTYIQQANDFISAITTVHEETITYEVRTLKSSNITDIQQLAGRPIGMLSTSPNCENVKTELSSAMKDFTPVDYDELGLMILDFYEGRLAAVVLNESYLSYLEETDYDLDKDTGILYDFHVNNEAKSDLRVPVDVVKEPFILYISGSDTRTGNINNTGRSDVNILAVINPAKGKILLVNIPRDYYVQLHGTTGLKDKLTHAGMYGINMSKATIEDLLGIKINYTFKVGFQGVKKLVDAIDGIDIDLPNNMKLPVVDQQEATKDRRQYCTYSKGWNHLDGTCALRYARERKSFKYGDLDRGKNQQQVITAIINKLTGLNYLAKYSQILNAAKGTFITSFTDTEITDFVRWQLTELKHWQVESIQIEGQASMQPTYSLGSTKLYVFLRNEASETAAKQKIAEYLTK